MTKSITDPDYATLCEHRCTKCGVRLGFFGGDMEMTHATDLCLMCRGAFVSPATKQEYFNVIKASKA